ncbi:unnamed protein product [Vitrella brassicaformis CCMP3155]|uniref:Proteasome subunit beta n=1 Tax=Vitrella brassicaformis (strain CCMP3155) TaxID=1169540 RepID=A0A0G4GX98_VITBC|nr:unnamed protein product [Vitrella brassicaformis CCMP3155]|eukprot:CEM35665.1 unnamed protein product [Vitrella brassicaformis CCMP3155]
MDSALGLRGKDFVLLATDGHAEFSVLRLKDDEDKIITIDKNKLMAAGGPSADRTMFCEYIQKNIHLYRLRNGVTLSVRAAANFTRECVYVYPMTSLPVYPMTSLPSLQ